MPRREDVTGTLDDGVRSPRLMDKAVRLLQSYERPASPDPAEPFETWLLNRLAHAVEAVEVPAELLTELRTEMERARELPHEHGHALAVQDIAERSGLPVDQAETMLAALEAQPTVIRNAGRL